MRIPEPLRNNPFRFRRRRSLHSKLYGEGRSDYIRPLTDTTGQKEFHVSTGSTHETYRTKSSEEYAAYPGFMQTPQLDYQPYDDHTMGNMPQLDRQRIIDEICFTAMELAGIRPLDEKVECDDCLITEEVFLQLIESLREQFSPEFDTNEIASYILAALSQDKELGIEQDLRENMIEIQMAVEQARDESLAEPNPEPSDFGLAIPQDFFEQQEQMLKSQFYEMQFAELDYGAQMEADFGTQEAMFEQPMEETGSMMDSGPQTLENIVETEQMQYEGGMPDDMSEMLASMDEGPVEQMYETPEHMEPYPEPLQDGYGMMPQEMYDEQMPDEMMPGPFGPMGFGPGGGP